MLLVSLGLVTALVSSSQAVTSNTIIAFTRVVNGDQHVWTMRQDGSQAKDITPSLAAGSNAYDPSVSPDGTQVVFSANIDNVNNRDLYIANIDGTNLQRFTQTTDADTQPSWKPTGNQIVFKVACSTGGSLIYEKDSAAAAATAPSSIPIVFNDDNSVVGGDGSPNYDCNDNFSSPSYINTYVGPGFGGSANFWGILFTTTHFYSQGDVAQYWGSNYDAKMITMDSYSDKDPVSSPDADRVIFASNRPDMINGSNDGKYKLFINETGARPTYATSLEMVRNWRSLSRDSIIGDNGAGNPSVTDYSRYFARRGSLYYNQSNTSDTAAQGWANNPNAQFCTDSSAAGQEPYEIPGNGITDGPASYSTGADQASMWIYGIGCSGPNNPTGITWVNYSNQIFSSNEGFNVNYSTLTALEDGADVMYRVDAVSINPYIDAAFTLGASNNVVACPGGGTGAYSPATNTFPFHWGVGTFSSGTWTYLPCNTNFGDLAATPGWAAESGSTNNSVDLYFLRREGCNCGTDGTVYAATVNLAASDHTGTPWSCICYYVPNVPAPYGVGQSNNHAVKIDVASTMTSGTGAGLAGGVQKLALVTRYKNGQIWLSECQGTTSPLQSCIGGARPWTQTNITKGMNSSTLGLTNDVSIALLQDTADPTKTSVRVLAQGQASNANGSAGTWNDGYWVWSSTEDAANGIYKDWQPAGAREGLMVHQLTQSNGSYDDRSPHFLPDGGNNLLFDRVPSSGNSTLEKVNTQDASVWDTNTGPPTPGQLVPPFIGTTITVPSVSPITTPSNVSTTQTQLGAPATQQGRYMYTTQSGSLWLTNEDGSFTKSVPLLTGSANAPPLPHGSGAVYVGDDFSPDGKYALIRYFDDTADNIYYRRIDIDASLATPDLCAGTVVNATCKTIDGPIACTRCTSRGQYSPLGDKVTYAKLFVGGNDSIYVAPADGSSAATQLTVGDHPYWAPTFSPDGTTIAASFACPAGACNATPQMFIRYFKMQSNGTFSTAGLVSQLVQQASTAVYHFSDLQYTPDGQYIVFARWTPGISSPAYYKRDIWKVKVGAATQCTATSLPDCLQITNFGGASAIWTDFPAVSGDGQSVIFALSHDNQTGEIWRVGVDGSGLKRTGGNQLRRTDYDVGQTATNQYFAGTGTKPGGIAWDQSQSRVCLGVRPR